MKKFLLKVALYSVFVSTLYVVAAFFADGNTDPFYVRMTSSKQNAMILGSSKGAQGILPSVIAKELEGLEIYNFGFTVNISPFGPIYTRSIEKKLSGDTSEPGVFILTVDPWMMSSVADEPENPSEFVENKGFLRDQKILNANPNFEYLARNYGRSWGDLIIQNIIFKGSKPQMFLHDDGWLEININMSEREVEKRTANKRREYDRKRQRLKFSNYRLSEFYKLCEMLQKRGKVILVRMPVDPYFRKLGDEISPDFDVIIQKYADKRELPYFNFSGEYNFSFTDGNHLYSKDAEKFTQILCDSIRSNNILF